MPHWLLHFLGTDSGSGPAYLWWSGFGANFGELTIAAALIALVRKHNCGVRRCWRLARHEFRDESSGIVHQLCRKHHPEHPGRPVTARHIQEQYHLYLGRQPGRG